MSKERPMIGTGHLAAMLRLGLRELRQAVYPESNIAQPPEPGTFGTNHPCPARESYLDGAKHQAALAADAIPDKTMEVER